MNRRAFLTALSTAALAAILNRPELSAAAPVTHVEIQWLYATGPLGGEWKTAEARWRPIGELEWHKSFLEIADGVAWFPGRQVGIVLSAVRPVTPSR